ncbi:MAG: ABC transporter permease [Bacteroidales bacterium]
MIKNYIFTAFRSFLRSRTSTFINVAGLAAGLAASMIILLYIGAERSSDRFNENFERIYRLEYGEFFISGTAQALIFKEAFTEVEQSVRFDYRYSPLIGIGEENFRFTGFLFADSTLFDVFSFKFVKGDPAMALHLPFSLVLTESEAEKIFGKEDPVGKILRFDNRHDYTVTAIIKDEKRSHLPVSAIGSFSSLPYVENDENHDRHLFSYMNFPTYFLLQEGSNHNSLARDFERHIDELFPDQRNFNISLRPLNDIYFNNNLKDSPPTRHGNLTLLNTLLAVVCFIMLIAIVNFINLATAGYITRARETGIRKMLGADRRSLIFQFLTESIILTLIALMIAIAAVELLLPVFNKLLLSDLAAGSFMTLRNILLLISAAVATGLIAGLYPAIYLSAGSGISKVRSSNTRRDIRLRTLLIVVQFTITIILIIGTLVVRDQVNYMKNKDTGFDKENVLIVRFNSDLFRQRDVFRERLSGYQDVRSVSLSNNLPGYIRWFNTWMIDGEQKPHNFLPVDPDYLDMMNIRLVSGRNFDWTRIADQENTFILNEEAVKYFGFEDPAGKEFIINGSPIRIIGVVEDFHFKPMHEEIGPLVLGWRPNNLGLANIRIGDDDKEGSIAYVKSVWNELSPGAPFEYAFLDDELDKLYLSEIRIEKLFRYFAMLAILIACMGLYGLSTFIAAQRTKEIGIRKVLGSSINGIMVLLISEFSRWVLVANIIAWPVAWFFSKTWLENFPYRIAPGIEIFAGAGIFALLIAVITVSGEAWHSARMNPAVTLKNE